MMDYKIEADSASKRHETRIRLLSWGTVLSLVMMSVLLFALDISGTLSSDSDLGWLFVFSVLGAAIGAVVLACREALRRAERQMVFVLEDDGIIRRREGWPEVKIAFSEMASVREELKRLVIESIEPRRKIAIPNDVRGFEMIHAELAKHHPLSARAKLPLRSIVLLTIFILSWAAVLWFRDMRIVIPASAIALISLALGSHRLWILRHRGPKRVLLWVCLGFTWFSAIFLIYIRVVRP